MDIEKRAERARGLLSDDLLSSAISEIERSALDRLTNCDPADAPGLQEAAHELRAVKSVVAALQAHIDSFAIQQKKGRHREQHD